jgi:hypothetical protein
LYRTETLAAELDGWQKPRGHKRVPILRLLWH